MSLLVYSSFGFRKISSTGPCSTTRPSFITATLWHSRLARFRSWVMKSMAFFWVSLILRSSSMIWFCMVTSRAVVGSSATISSGSRITAMAIITRWRMPPESWWG